MKEIKSSLQITTPEQEISLTSPYGDLELEDWIHLFYTAMIGISFTPVDVLTGLQNYVTEYCSKLAEGQQDVVVMTGPPAKA